MLYEVIVKMKQKRINGDTEDTLGLFDNASVLI